MKFDGTTYDPACDKTRLSKQIDRVFALMIDGQWRTLSEISYQTQDPESSISARLRDLRKERFGNYVVNRRSRGERHLGLFEYQLIQEDPTIGFNFDERGQGVFA